MTTTIDGLRLRRALGRNAWLPPEPFGPDGWLLDSRFDAARVIVTSWRDDGIDWTHASMSHADRVPTYDELCLLHRAVWGDDGWAYQVHAPREAHVNLHAYVLHLWGRADGRAVLPNFGKYGTI